MDIMVVPFVAVFGESHFVAGTGYTFRLNFGGNNRNLSLGNDYCVYIGDLEASVTDTQLYNIFKEKYMSFSGAKVAMSFSSDLDYARKGYRCE